MVANWWGLALALVTQVSMVAVAWIRARSRARVASDRLRMQTLRQLVRDLPEGGEFHEQRRDGSTVTLSRRLVASVTKLAKPGGRRG